MQKNYPIPEIFLEDFSNSVKENFNVNNLLNEVFSDLDYAT